jgi:hypothetical protein
MHAKVDLRDGFLLPTDQPGGRFSCGLSNGFCSRQVAAPSSRRRWSEESPWRNHRVRAHHRRLNCRRQRHQPTHPHHRRRPLPGSIPAAIAPIWAAHRAGARRAAGRREPPRRRCLDSKGDVLFQRLLRRVMWVQPPRSTWPSAPGCAMPAATGPTLRREEPTSRPLHTW